MIRHVLMSILSGLGLAVLAFVGTFIASKLNSDATLGGGYVVLAVILAAAGFVLGVVGYVVYALTR